MIELRKQQRLKRVMDCRGDFGSNDSVAFGIDQEDSGGPAERAQVFRNAHLGFYDYLDTIGIIGALEQVLAGLGRKIEFGAGLRAAQNVYAESLAKQEELAVSR